MTAGCRERVLGAGTGTGVFLIALLMLMQVLPPQVSSQRAEMPQAPVELRDRPEPEETRPDPLEEGFRVVLASVDLPKPKKPEPARAVNTKTSTARPAAPVITVAPTARVLAKGWSLLNAGHDNRENLPQIYGDFSHLGFRNYLASVLRNGGKLVVYDASGSHGPLPVAELDEDCRRKSSGTGYTGYYIERPRLLQSPYSNEIQQALAGLRSLYPDADLRPALVLPRKTEAYILGALHEALGGALTEYDYLRGEYRNDAGGGLVFTIRNGKGRKQETEAALAKQVQIPLGRL